MKKYIISIALALSLMACKDKEQEEFQNTANQQCEKIWYILDFDLKYRVTHRSNVSGEPATNGKVFLSNGKSYEIICK